MSQILVGIAVGIGIFAVFMLGFIAATIGAQRSEWRQMRRDREQRMALLDQRDFLDGQPVRLYGAEAGSRSTGQTSASPSASPRAPIPFPSRRRQDGPR
ncbi:MAG: hypothetical protein ACYCU5_14680 [Actinomycetes bacterium]